MRPQYVLDTNVLIVASAVDIKSKMANKATPDDPDLRLHVLNWLINFQESSSYLVLDGNNKILDEYENNLDFNDFGRQVVLHKMSTCAVNNVEVIYDKDGYAVLDGTLEKVIHDASDRKLVAAALAAKAHSESSIANASDTDWCAWEKILKENNIFVEQILDDWVRDKYMEKKGKRNKI